MKLILYLSNVERLVPVSTYFDCGSYDKINMKLPLQWKLLIPNQLLNAFQQLHIIFQVNKLPGLGTRKIQRQMNRMRWVCFGRLTCWTMRTAASAIGLDYGNVRDLRKLGMRTAVHNGGRAVHCAWLVMRCFWTGATILTLRSSVGMSPPLSQWEGPKILVVLCSMWIAIYVYWPAKLRTTFYFYFFFKHRWASVCLSTLLGAKQCLKM